MQKSTNYGLNLPDLSDQFNLNHWNENTEKLDLELKKETDSRINNDNQLQSNINNSVSTLRNEISTAETNAKNLANATGVLSVAKGGTGETTGTKACNSLLKSLETGVKVPIDTDTFISQYAGGSASNETSPEKDNYYRRPVSTLWEYIKSKISSVLGLTASNYNGTSAKAISDGSENNIVNTYATKKEVDKHRTMITGDIFYQNRYYKFNVVGYYARAIEFEIKTSKTGALDKLFFGQEVKANCIRLGKTPRSEYRYIAPTSNKSNGVLLIKSNDKDGTLIIFNTANYEKNTCFLETATEDEWNSGTDFPITEFAINSVVTTTENGLMSSADKSKLNGINSNIITCSTSAGTASKTVSVTGFTLVTGACIRVLFTNGNNVAKPTLNVNGTGAKEIRVKHGNEYVPLSAPTGSTTVGAYGWDSNTLLELFYTGTYWIANENAIVHENLSSELNYLSSRVFINGRKELWGRTSGFDLDANGIQSMIVQSDLSINENNRSNHAMSVITDPDSYDINSYGLLNLTYDILRFSIYIRNLKADKYNGQSIQIFVTGY